MGDTGNPGREGEGQMGECLPDGFGPAEGSQWEKGGPDAQGESPQLVGPCPGDVEWIPWSGLEGAPGRSSALGERQHHSSGFRCWEVPSRGTR